MKTLLFKIAHSVKHQFDNFSQALTYAWKIIKLKMKMKENIVDFQYRKVDGSIRQAQGTLIDRLLPTTKGNRSSSQSVLVYYDVEKQGYRSCKIENLIF